MILALRLRLAKLVSPIRLPALRRARKADARITSGACQRSLCTDRLRSGALARPHVRHAKIPSSCPPRIYRVEFHTRAPSVLRWSSTPQVVPLLVASRAEFTDPTVSITEYPCPPLDPLVSLCPRTPCSVMVPQVRAMAVPSVRIDSLTGSDCTFSPVIRVDAHPEWVQAGSPPWQSKQPSPHVSRPPRVHPGSTPAISRGKQGGAGERQRPGGSLPPPARGPHRGAHAFTVESVHERPARHRVDILCWREGMEWVFGCELSADTADLHPVTILQREVELQPDTQHENRWIFENLEDEIVLNVPGDMPTKIALGKGGQYLLFKLSERLRERGAEGRRMPRLTGGTYLVVVPTGWMVADEDAATIVAGPEATRCPEHGVYIIACDREDRRGVAFRTGAGQQERITSGQQQFNLEGTTIPDFTPDRGPLFVSNPPRIRVAQSDVWANLRTIVVGLERGEAARLQVAFAPVRGEVIELPPEVQNQAGGWYFLRFYDAKGELLESMDFRFLRTLHGVEVPQVPPFPGPDGHSSCEIVIAHEPGTRIESRTRQLADNRITQSGSHWILQVPSDPEEDEVALLVRCGTDVAVPLTLRVERLWWGVGTESCQPSQWNDHPFSLQRSDLTATTPRALWIRLPTVHWVKEVHLGFLEEELRTYPPLASKPECCVPLRNFSSAACREVIGRHPLILRVERDGEWYEGTIATVAVAAVCSRCEHTADSLEAIPRHLESAHLDELFRRLKYSEIVQRLPHLRLPPKIYQCRYCPQIVPDDDYSSPTSAITHHIERECPNVDRTRPITLRFRAIEDLEEIRAVMEADFVARLQDVYICTLCRDELVDADRAELARHLRHHLDREGAMSGELYTLE